jgi:hypothetical protein
MKVKDLIMLLKPCGCVYDTLNGAVVEFCEKHQKEHNAWVLYECQSTVC